jgi:hypothetical protein
MTTDKIAALAPPILSVSDSIILQPAEIDDAERYWNLVADNHDRLSNWIQIENQRRLLKTAERPKRSTSQTTLKAMVIGG